MTPAPRPVVLLFAFANDRVKPALYLRNLPEEHRQVRTAMATAVQAGLCEVVELANATLDEVLGIFQDPAYRDRIAVFHFGGHAGSGALMLESRQGAATTAYAPGLARFLAEQKGLKLVFLNGCSSRGHVQGLLDAGIPGVIATSQAIDDEVATELSARFYKALASGSSIPTAYSEASAAAQTRYGARVWRDLDPDPRTPQPAEDRWPWDLYRAPGAEEDLDRWSLPQAAGDSLFGLPPLPALDFPPSPFRYLAPFSREEATVFFGRDREIRELFDALNLPEGAPIVLLFGAAGAGKSSLLAAGLQPRLEMACDVLYLRRDGAQGLAGTLARGLASAAAAASEATPAAEAWRLREASTGQPLIVILDQAEEAWTRSLPGGTEAAEFAAVLRPLFAARQDRPRGRLLLSFRKEWLAEVLRLLDAARLPYHRVELAHLDHQGISGAAASLPSSAPMRRHYGLEVEPDLPGLLAADLLADPDATIAPALQILLTKMWSQAIQASPAAPCFTVELYRDMKRQGILLDDFLKEQIQRLADSRPELVSSGLVLDLLMFHTTSLGSAETRTAKEVAERYGGSQEITELLEQCQDRYLLSIAALGPGGGPRTTRLAHDTLAPLVRHRFETSDLPGQRALRILEQRAREWQGGQTGPPLDAFDLIQVVAGQRGMRVRTPDEERLIAASRRQAVRRWRERRGLELAAVIAVAMILGAAVWALWQGHQARLSEERSRSRANAALAVNLALTHPTEAALVLLEVRQPDSTPSASSSLCKVLGEPVEIAILTGHTDSARIAAFSPDGTRVVTGSDDHTARIWNAATGQPIAILNGHKAWLSAASFSPDGTRVITASIDHTARIWNAATGQPIATLTGHAGGIRAASFSPDGTRIITASDDQTARIWKAATGQLIAILNGHKGRVSRASFSPDGTWGITASDDHTARIWNAATGQLIATLTGHTKGVRTASFSPNGTRVITASDDHTARVWDVATGQPIATLNGHTGEIVAASFSPDGTRVVTASVDRTARIWNAASGQSIATLTGHTGWIEAASFNSDGTWVMTASSDGPARIWNAASGQPVAALTGHTGRVFTALFSPDGARVVTASSDKTARIWNVGSTQAVATITGHTGRVYAASFSPDGARVVTASKDKTARIWNAATGQLITTLTGHTGEVAAASFSPDGTRVVTASVDNTARIWNAATGQPIAVLTGHESLVFDASFSPDGTRVVTASDDHTARIWNADAGQLIATLNGHTDAVYASSFSPDGTRVVTASKDQTARIWNAATSRPIATLTGHTSEIVAASFSPDGTRVVTASVDRTARIWNAASGQPIAVLTGHESVVFDASFSPDGTRVVTASQDHTARIWNAASGQPIATLIGHTRGVPAASFSPDGTRVVTASADRTARIWTAATGQPIAILTGHTHTVWEASFSPDGTRVVTSSIDGTARVWPGHGEYFQSLARARTPLCLPVEFRKIILEESPLEAELHERACKVCVPKFFAHLQGVPSGDSKTYLIAWREYQRCFSEMK